MKAKIATLTIAALISAPAFAQYNATQTFEQQVFSAHAPVNAVELSQTEMKETEGEVAPVVLLPMLVGANVGAWSNHAKSYAKTGQPASVTSTIIAAAKGAIGRGRKK